MSKLPMKAHYLIVSDRRVYGLSTSLGSVEAQRASFRLPFEVLPVKARSYRQALNIAMYDLDLTLDQRMSRVYQGLPRMKDLEKEVS